MAYATAAIAVNLCRKIELLSLPADLSDEGFVVASAARQSYLASAATADFHLI